MKREKVRKGKKLITEKSVILTLQTTRVHRGERCRIRESCRSKMHEDLARRAHHLAPAILPWNFFSSFSFFGPPEFVTVQPWGLERRSKPMPLPERGVALQARSKTFTEVALFVFYWVSVSPTVYLSLCSLGQSVSLSAPLSLNVVYLMQTD